MSHALRLPPELRAFLEAPGPRSLLIRGAPGAGKSTLALAMLEAYAGPKLYVTGRLDAGVLTRDHPWLGSDEGSGIEVIDSVTTQRWEVEPSADPPGEPPSGAGSPNPPPPADLRLPPALVQAWRRAGQSSGPSGDLSWIPRSLQGAWRRIASNQTGLNVVDSWDAFVEELSDAALIAGAAFPDRLQFERALLRQIHRGGSHVVLVQEYQVESQLGYLVDAIVELRRDVFEGNLERWMSFPKLRGMRIEFPSYLFTLEGGRFQCITPIPGAYRIRKVVAEPDPQRESESLWPGSTQFARTFGRMPAGSVTIFEVDAGVPEASYEALAFPAILTALREWARVVMLAPPVLRLDDLWHLFEGMVPRDVLASQMRFVYTGRPPAPGHPILPLLLPIPVDPTLPTGNPRVPKAIEFLSDRSATDVPNLLLVSADALRAIARLFGSTYSSENPPPILPITPTGAPIHTIFLGSTGDPMIESVRNLAALHLRLKNREGRTLVYGLRPTTPGFVLTVQADDRPYELLRIV